MLTMTSREPVSGRASPQRHARQLGMSLTEVLVSMVIFAIGVLGLFGSHATAFGAYSDAKSRVDASLLADRLISEMWVDRANAAAYSFSGYGDVTQTRLAPWFEEVRRTLPEAGAVVRVNGNEVEVTVTWQPRGGDQRTHTAVATLQEP
jgi:type IV pilus assembly protein PilV